MIREVDLVSYLPEFMQSYTEPVAALEGENPEFDIMWKAVDRVLCNRFIVTADEYGISRFEKMLGIHPANEDTLESRRSRVHSKWFNRIPYTWKTLLQKLIVLCSDTDFTLTHNFTEGYTLTIQTNLELFGQVEELETIINQMIPCNIVIDSQNSIPCNIKGAALFGGGLVFINGFTITNDFKEVFAVESNIAFGGGVVNVEGLEVSDSFNETMRADGSASIGGGVVHTAMLQITEDFNETLKANGDALVASGVVTVDFIEIK